MSPTEAELIAVLRHGYAAHNSGDFDSAVRSLHPEFELIPTGGQSPIRGAAAMRAWMEPDAFASQTMEPIEFTAVGNKVLVHQQVHSRAAQSGIELDFEAWAVWT